jgi:hypothetical protein
MVLLHAGEKNNGMQSIYAGRLRIREDESAVAIHGAELASARRYIWAYMKL